MPPAAPLLEYGLYCEDVDRATLWYQRLFAFPLIMTEADRLRALQCGPQQVLLLFKRGGSREGVPVPNAGFIPRHDGSGDVHLAFSMQPNQISHWAARLQQLSVDIESTVHWPEGGTSFYFRDPDGHLLELITPRQWPFQPWPDALPERISTDANDAK